MSNELAPISNAPGFAGRGCLAPAALWRLRILLLLAAIGACSSKQHEGDEKPKQPATDTAVPAPPWRIGFRLDDAPKDVFIPRPTTPEGVSLSSFIAKRAQDVGSWEQIEVELANGGFDVLTPEASSDYRLFARPKAGIDLVVQSAAGERQRLLGPVRRVHVLSRARNEIASRPAGQRALVVQLGSSQHERSAAQLETLPTYAMPGPGEKQGWSLADALAPIASLRSVESIEVIAPDRVRQFTQKEVASGQTLVLLRHNSRGELRLKVIREGHEDAAAGMRNVTRVVLHLREGHP